jgi:hypothetical protein
MEGFDNDKNLVYVQQSAQIRPKCAPNPRSFLMTVLGKDFECPKLYKASL